MDGTVHLNSERFVGTKAAVVLEFARGGPPQDSSSGVERQRDARIQRSISSQVLERITRRDSPSEEQPNSPVEEQRPCSTIRVLVVEDNAINRKVATTHLRNIGFTVDATRNGEEALLYLDNTSLKNDGPPDIIFMDCQMPPMDGYEATRILRTDTIRFDVAHRSVPVVALTASTVKGDAKRCNEAGMNEYLMKPARKNTLEQTVLKWTAEQHTT